MVCRLCFSEDGLQFRQDDQPLQRRALRPEDTARFGQWASRYDRATRLKNHEELLKIGQEIFAWLDADGHGSGSKLASTAGEIRLDIVTSACPDEDERGFLNIPWELLAWEGVFLAEDELRPFCIQRRLGDAATPHAPNHQDLAVMFMAAAPRNVSPGLDFEAEEAGILAATANLPLLLTVEESGSAGFLKDRLAAEGPFDIVHLTCHGDIQHSVPLLALEDEAGDLALTSAAGLVDAFGSDKPRLVFLSACRTAEQVGHSAPLAISLMHAGLPAVLGWDGSVYDTDASRFAREAYAELAHKAPPVLAVAKARQRLLRSWRENTGQGAHWHMARLYVSPDGGGPLCAVGAKSRPNTRGRAYQVFLGKETQQVPVAGPAAFVGRRRALQDVFRAFRDQSQSGVLIHGFGGHGKSSLAARIADRLSRHKTALVFRFYDAERVFEAALQAVPGEQHVTLRETWLPLIQKNVANLKAALIQLLNGPCASYETNAKGEITRQPMLLIIDDLERILEPPTAGGGTVVAVRESHRPVLAAVLEAFADACGQSHLILTSRYDFALTGGSGADLTARLARVPLSPFDDLERIKQQSAAARAQVAPTAQSEADAQTQVDLLARCRVLAHGNPLIQERLTHTALAEPKAAAAALDKMEAYLTSGAKPDGEDLSDLFTRLAFETYAAALSKDEAEAFRTLTLFELPVPESALRATARLLAHEAADAALKRLHVLGLLDRFEPWAKGGEAEALANALARPQFKALTDDEQQTLAVAALPPLMAAWTDAGNNLPFGARSLELYRLAVLAGDLAAQAKAAHAGIRWLQRHKHDPKAALGLAEPALTALAQAGIPPDPGLLQLGIEVAERLGETQLQDEWLAKIETLGGTDDRSQAMLWLAQVERLITKGAVEEAEPLLHRAEAAFRASQDERHIAITRGRIADILQARGDLDDALRVYEELLPVFERLGDVRSRAIVMGNMADILFSRGDLDEALRIRREEMLPVYERLGEVRLRAITMGKIADILFSRDDLDEALRIRREEQLPVFELLGDIRERAVAMGRIADILIRRGDLDEALRVCREEQLPIFERLGDVRSRAVTMGRIADILEARGDPGEALRIHEEQLPVFERLGDVHSRALTMGKIAAILAARGDLDEALRVHREELLLVVERLGDDSWRALTMGKIAAILVARGDLDEALRVRREELLPVIERLGDDSWRALTLGTIADNLEALGDLDEALRVRREELLPVVERLGDDSWRALTLGSIADNLQARGDLDEALRIRREGLLPVFERLGDVDSRAFTMVQIAAILVARGDLDEALRICREELLPVSHAFIMGSIADILFHRGDLDDALRIYREELLPVFERLGDVSSRAVTMRQIANILYHRGDLDEALLICREELPVFEQLGDVSSRAVTMRLIAAILEARGDLDEALRIHEEECRPVFDHLGDVDGMIAVLVKASRIRRQRGIDDLAGFERVKSDLVKATRLALDCGRLDAICTSAEDLGMLILWAGGKEEAKPLLVQARNGWVQLGKTQTAENIDQLLQEIESAE